MSASAEWNRSGPVMFGPAINEPEKLMKTRNFLIAAILTAAAATSAFAALSPAQADARHGTVEHPRRHAQHGSGQLRRCGGLRRPGLALRRRSGPEALRTSPSRSEVSRSVSGRKFQAGHAVRRSSVDGVPEDDHELH